LLELADQDILRTAVQNKNKILWGRKCKDS
jgi:hypothetical protein